MTQAYDKSLVRSAVTNLPHQHRIAFGALCCERLFGSYSAFVQDMDWGDEALLRRVIDLIWQLVQDPIVTDEVVRSAISACEAGAPDADEFDSLYTGPAQNAVFAICSTLDYVLSHQVERLVQTSSFAIDTVDLFVQELEDMPTISPGLESRISDHSLMQREILRQMDDLQFLSGDISPSEIRVRAQTKGSIEN